MADIDPSIIPLPAILDPILSYLSSVLPPPLYSFLLTLLSHSLALFTALISLCYTLISSRPWEWDAQTVIPPLITFLAAYLALVSLYRTTSWMFQTGVWVMKWGTILGALVAGAGWVATQAGGGGGGGGVGQAGGSGMMSFLGGLILDAINGRGQNAAGGSRARSRSRTQPQSRTRPNAWEPFQQQQQQQRQTRSQRTTNANRNERNNERTEGGDGVVQGIIESIVGAAERGGWLDAARSAMDGFQNVGRAGGDTEAGRKQPTRKAKAKGTGVR
jgi:hypothetical protein